MARASCHNLQVSLGNGLDMRNIAVGNYSPIWSNYSDLTRPHPKWWHSKGNPLISGKTRLVKYYNLASPMFVEGYFFTFYHGFLTS